VTLINQLIRQAREGATVLDVPENYVGSVAEHIRQTNYYASVHLTAADCAAKLRAGDVKLCGVPLRVVPKREG